MHARSLQWQYVLLCAIALTCVSACDGFVPSMPQPKQNGQSRKGSDNAKGSQSSSGLDPISWAQRLEGLKSNAAKLAAELNDLNTQLAQLFSVKESLCQRQASLMSACIAHTPLAPTLWRNGAACKNDRKSWDVRSFKAEITGINGQFQILLDNSIESNIFQNDKAVTLVWSARGNRSLKELRLSDIGSIKLKAIEGNLSSLENATFSLKIDDKELLTEKDFILQSRTESAVVLSQVTILNELSLPQCRVDEHEIDEISQVAISKAEIPSKIDAPAEAKDANSESRSKTFEEWINNTRTEVSTKGDTYLALAQDVSRLRRDLRGELQLGCWAKSIVKSIELNFKGSHLPLSDWDRSLTQQQLGITGSPTQTTVDFGGGLKFTNSDENSFALFREGGKWVLNATTDLTIGDISNIQIQKGGYSYQSLKNCWSTWGGLSTACEWQNRESDRYQLDGLSIKINGQTIYQNESLNIGFERRSLKWVEKDLTANAAYVELMRRRDCPVSIGPR